MIVKNLLKIGERFDNRQVEEARALTTELIANSALVGMGDSLMQVVFQRCSTRPYADKPQEGIVNLSVSLGSRRFDRVSNFLHKIYIKQKCVDLESLCVRFGEEAALIQIDVRILSSDGGMYALAVAGVNSALSRLEVLTNFVPRCFFYCSVGGVIIDDPSERELEESGWSSVVVMRSYREVLFVEKIGEECSAEDILEIVDRSFRRCSKQR